MKYYGFNFPWMYYTERGRPPAPVDEKALDFLVAEGFDLARFPLHYHFWSKPGEYLHPDERTAALIDGYVEGCRSRGIHAMINLHQAPGYSVSSQRHALEVHNLWADQVAQDAFVRYWEFFAHRYKELGPDEVIFNPVNEPPAPGDRQFTQASHDQLMRRVATAIWAIDPDRALLIDGTHYGTAPSSGLADLKAAQGVRGYLPLAISHYGAAWEPAFKSLPPPVWPGLVADGRVWDKQALYDIFKSWRELEAAGVAVHVTEFGCFNVTPNGIALRWLADQLAIFREYQWGWALWEFEGTFGVVNHGRPGTRYENIHGYQVDRDLLELLRPPPATSAR